MKIEMFCRGVFVYGLIITAVEAEFQCRFLHIWNAVESISWDGNAEN